MCIFARELASILKQHEKHLGSLYAVQVGNVRIHPRQIQRLKRAADGDCSSSVTLNPDELDAVARAFAFDEQDLRHLRAALLAESVARFLLDRVERERALAIAEQFFAVLLSPDPEELAEWGEDALEGTRDVEDLSVWEIEEDEENEEDAGVVADMEVEHELEPAFGLYDEAALWITQARETGDEVRRRAYAGMAATLLAAANELLAYPTGLAQDTQALAECRQLVADASQLAHELAGSDLG